MLSYLARIIPFYAIILCVNSGCTDTVVIVHRGQLADPEKFIELRALGNDGTLYYLDNYKLHGNQLIASGTSKKDGRESDFAGALNLSDLQYIECRRMNTIGTLVAIAAAGTAAGIILGDFLTTEKSSLAIEQRTEVYIPPPRMSCPYVYTFDGSNYHFESETFAGAVFKGAERSCFDYLYHLKPVNGKYTLKLTNERPETDYINEIKLLVVDAQKGYKIIPDWTGKIHTILKPEAPVSSMDFSGKNAIEKILRKDGVVWESDLSDKDLSMRENAKDGLELEFSKPENAKTAKLVVNGRNTALGVYAFEQLFKLMGENKLSRLSQLETDPKEAKKLIDFMLREGMLHVKIWHNDQWVEQALLPDVGPVLAKYQVALLDVSQIRGDRLRIRLEATTDLWSIDHVYIDYSPDAPVNVSELAVTSVMDIKNRNVVELLENKDNRYLVTMRGDELLLEFPEIHQQAGVNRHFVLKSVGYYHQWIYAEGPEQPEILNRILTESYFGLTHFLPIWKNVRPIYESH